MFKTMIARIMNFALLSLLPILAGCNGGGGGGGSTAGGISGGLSDAGLTTITAPDTFSATAASGSEVLATLHNPEPATMLLLGGGFAALAIMRSKKFQKR